MQREVQKTADIRFRATVVMASLVSHVRNVAMSGFVPGNTFYAVKDTS